MIRIAIVAVFVSLASAAAFAVDSVNIEQASTEQFQEGAFENVVVNNLGELKLARKLDVLLKADSDVVFVNAMAADSKGFIYAATAPKGKLFRISPEGKVELWWTAKETTLQSLAIGAKDELYVGTGGGQGRIYRVTAKDTAVPVLQREGLAYVWAMTVLPDGRLIAGTGPKAELVLLVPGDKPVAGEVLFAPEKEKQKNIMAVAADAAGRTIFFGTDTDGLVFRFDLAARKPFLLYDADESEISSIVVSPEGVLYVATSDPSAAGEGGPSLRLGPSGPGMPGGGPVMGDELSAKAEQADEPDDESKPAPDASAEQAPAAEPATRPDSASPQDRRPTGEVTATRPEQTSRPMPRSTPPMARAVRPGGPGGAMMGRPGGPGQAGNAIYKIDRDGFVNELLRQPTLLLSMMLVGEQLIVGTGTDGRVLAIRPGSDEIATLARPTDVKQIMAMVPGRDGTIVIGSANDAIIARINAGYADKGSYTSKPIDAKAISRWGVISEVSNTSDGGSVRVQVRSGNLAEPTDALWSSWTEPVSAREPVTINCPPARFVQYRVILASDKPTVTPSVNAIRLSYISENRPPRLTAARVITPGSSAGGGDGDGPTRGPGGPAMRSAPRPPMPSRPGMPGGPGGDGESSPGGMVMIAWTAVDPNDDTLEATLCFRRVGSAVWVPMVDKPIREQNYQWQTRGLPDGQYQVRVVVSDRPSNPPAVAKEDSRLTDVFVIDNTPPVINNLRVVEKKDGKVTLAADVNDALSRLTGAQVKVNSVTADGQVLLPVDGIWDQRNESLRFTVDLSDKPAGGNMVFLTVTDLAGNTAVAAIEVSN